MKRLTSAEVATNGKSSPARGELSGSEIIRRTNINFGDVTSLTEAANRVRVRCYRSNNQGNLASKGGEGRVLYYWQNPHSDVMGHVVRPDDVIRTFSSIYVIGVRGTSKVADRRSATFRREVARPGEHRYERRTGAKI